MAFAINIRSDNETAGEIRRLWARCGRLEASPSIPAMDYPPHITLAIYNKITPNDLFSAFAAAREHLEPSTIRFDSLGYFEAPHAIILWARPTLPPSWQAAHEAIHASIGAHRCRRNYQPEFWTPHASLATAIDLDRKADALAIVEQSIEPFDVAFDVADCASFMPVRVLKEARLD